MERMQCMDAKNANCISMMRVRQHAEVAARVHVTQENPFASQTNLTNIVRLNLI